ncbi:hypothetical protein Hanom_Chr10g00932941 [Helianthus anomalus]
MEYTFPGGLRYKTLFRVRGSSTVLIVNAATSLSFTKTPTYFKNSVIHHFSVYLSKF